MWFYTADNKLCNYKNYFSVKYKNRNKLIQSRTLGKHTKNQDCPGKIKTVGKFSKTRNNKHDWNSIKYLNVLCHNRTQKQLRCFSKYIAKI